MKITLTTTINQKNNLNKYNKTCIDLGECEILLRKYYNLTNNETLYIKRIDVKQEGMRIPKIVFNIYSKLTELNLIQLNLSICLNTKIFLYIPIEITDNLDILNSSSGYYNDICYTTKSESGTDIILTDRKNEYINKTVCQDDCEFSCYNHTSKKANCSCNVKESSFSFANIKIDTKKLLNNFKNIKNYANFKLLTCHKNLFSKEGLIKNVGSYIYINIIIIHVTNIFIFYIKQFDLLKNNINILIFAIKNLNLINTNNKKKKVPKKENNNFRGVNSNNNIINNNNNFNNIFNSNIALNINRNNNRNNNRNINRNSN